MSCLKCAHDPEPLGSKAYKSAAGRQQAESEVGAKPRKGNGISGEPCNAARTQRIVLFSKANNRTV